MKAKHLLFALLLTACGEASQSGDQESTAVNSSAPELTSENFLNYFPEYSTDSLTIEVEAYTHEKEILDSESVPLAYMNYFNGFINQTKSESTGAKPLGKLKVQDGLYFLTLVQQDDYGPIYYGILFDQNQDKVISKEIIAEHWGDAGDSQVTYSHIKVLDGQIRITKQIETCHADIDIDGDEAMVTDEECNDSTAVVKIGQESKIKK